MVGVLKSWSTTASSNGNADSNISYQEGQSPASLNDSARAMMAALKGFANQITAAKTTGGSSNAYTFTSDAAAAISTSYAAGMGFVFKANHTNTGAATFNADGVGAKAIRKGGAHTALAANDIVENGIYAVFYEASADLFVLINPDTGVAGAGQPLDATLTALAALSWASGNALVQFTAADTVSLTLAPSVTSVTASNGTGATTAAGTFVNATDNASVRAIRIEGDRATPASGDVVYASFYLSNASGTQTDMAQIWGRATSVTAGAESAEFRFYSMNAGSMVDLTRLSVSGWNPITNDRLPLGAGTLAWSDLFLASGGVINWNNGNAVLTHSNGLLEITTGAFTGRIPRSSETSGTLTVASRNRVVACSGGVTLPASVFTADDVVALDPGTSSRTITRGSGLTMYLNGTDVASATLAANQMGYAYYRSPTVCVLSGAFS